MHPCKIQAHKENVSKGSGEKKKTVKYLESKIRINFSMHAVEAGRQRQNALKFGAGPREQESFLSKRELYIQQPIN